MSSLSSFLEPTEFIDSDSKDIVNAVKEVYSKSSSHLELIIELFYYVRDRIKYNVYVPYLDRSIYKASYILKSGYGYCVQKAILLTALYRAASIPAKVCFADIINHNLPKRLQELFGTNIFLYHGYTEAYINGRWIKLTPIFDIETSRKMNIEPLDFNGYNDVLLPRYNREGKPQFTYLKYRGCYKDFPYEEMAKAFVEFYNDKMKY